MTEFLGHGQHMHGQPISKLELVEPQSIIPEDLAHPIRILMEEHAILIKYAEQAKKVAESLKGAQVTDYAQIESELNEMLHIAHHLINSENHYLREENVLFPYLEKHGITGPPAAMWIEHEKIRETKKSYHLLVQNVEATNINDFLSEAARISDYLATTLLAHFHKENNVLFQMALKVMEEDEWLAVREEFDDIGYCCFTPKLPKLKTGENEIKTGPTAQQIAGVINFEAGHMLPNEVDALLNTLPLEITFIDSNDKVRYFNRSKERLFVRTKAVLGRNVQQCHPQKSIHLVNQILSDFKSSRKDEASFWINFKDRFVLIRFFAVRDRDGNYLGCMEVVQDITDIKRLEGEKRLL
ncbi:MAG: PAS domain-containing protein [Actinomycetota bacterium]